MDDLTHALIHALNDAEKCLDRAREIMDKIIERNMKESDKND